MLRSSTRATPECSFDGRAMSGNDEDVRVSVQMFRNFCGQEDSLRRFELFKFRRLQYMLYGFLGSQCGVFANTLIPVAFNFPNQGRPVSGAFVDGSRAHCTDGNRTNNSDIVHPNCLSIFASLFSFAFCFSLTETAPLLDLFHRTKYNCLAAYDNR